MVEEFLELAQNECSEGETVMDLTRLADDVFLLVNAFFYSGRSIPEQKGW